MASGGSARAFEVEVEAGQGGEAGDQSSGCSRGSGIGVIAGVAVLIVGIVVVVTRAGGVVQQSALSTPLETWAWHAAESEQRAMFWLCLSMIGMFAFFALALLKVNAPYGRYAESETFKDSCTAIKINGTIAWFLQELPTLIAVYICWQTALPELRNNLGNQALLLAWTLHYTNRTLIHPLLVRGGKPTQLFVMLSAMLFCAVNGYVQCRCLTQYVLVPFWSPMTIIGLLVWLLGLSLNLHSDHILRNLRKPGDTGYKIPQGGLFEYVSGANFTAEILEWIGFAIAGGVAVGPVMFAFCTAFNIGPRAVAHHQWYLERFGEDYPKSRKRLIPFIY